MPCSAMVSVKDKIKRFLPKPVHHLFNRMVSSMRIRRKLGEWFDLEWKQRAADASDRTWVETYDKSWDHWADHDLSRDDLARIRKRVGECEALLDAGCGDGYLLEALNDNAGKRYGTDLSGKGLMRARERLGMQVPLVQAFLEALPFCDNAFEVVVSTHVLEHVKQLHASYTELKRVCSRRLIIVVPRQEYLPYTEDYHLHFFPEVRDLRDALNEYDGTVECFTVPEGECAYAGDVWVLTVDM